MNMGNGNRSGLVDGTDEAASLECDVGLGLRMQGTESFPSKRMMMAMPHHHPHHHHHVNPCSESSMGGDGGVYSAGGGAGDGGSGGGGPIDCNLSNQQLASLNDIYDAIGAGSVSGAPRTLHPFSTSDSSFKSSGQFPLSLLKTVHLLLLLLLFLIFDVWLQGETCQLLLLLPKLLLQPHSGKSWRDRPPSTST